MERSEQNADILYEDLKKNIMDVIKESQIKLGFEKNPVTIYYPIEALNHLLDTDLGEEQMDQCLQNFAKKVKDPLRADMRLFFKGIKAGMGSRYRYRVYAILIGM